MDTGRRHKTLDSETKDSLILTATTEARASAFLHQFPEPQFPQSDAKGWITPLGQCIVV